MWHDNECVCIYIYICVCVYVCMYVCMCVYEWMYMCGYVCVYGWVSKEGDLLSGIFEVVPECPEDILCVYWHESHAKSSTHKNLLVLKKRTKDVSQSRAEGQSVRSETLEHGVKTEQWRWRDESAYLVAV